MTANTDRAQLELGIAGRTELLDFGIHNTILLQKKVGDPLAFVAGAGGTENFLAEAIHSGLHAGGVKCKYGAKTVRTWIADDRPITVNGKQVKLQKLVVEILYAIARGKRKDEREEMLEALDEHFDLGNDSKSDASGNQGSTTSSDSPPASD